MVAERYAQLSAALPNARLHYAVKANPASEVLRLLVRQGAAFDIASPAEMAACLAAGAEVRNLSDGNTAKKEGDIAAAFAQGVRVFSFDDVSELAKLTRAAPGSTVCCRLATSGAGADWALSDKFGCPPEVALELLSAAAADGHAVGLAFHVGSQQRDPSQWDAPLHRVGMLQAQLAERGIPLALLNLGGGFPGSYREPVPPITEYGEAIGRSIERHLHAPLPRLVAEPGRYLVADAGVIHAEVVLVSDRCGRRWVYLDVGRFGGLAETLDEAIEYRIDTVRDGGPVGPVVLAGPTCDSVDVLYRHADYQLPLDLTVGDRVRLHSTGAYTSTYSSVGFNGLPPLPVRITSHPAGARMPRQPAVTVGSWR